MSLSCSKLSVAPTLLRVKATSSGGRLCGPLPTSLTPALLSWLHPPHSSSHTRHIPASGLPAECLRGPRLGLGAGRGRCTLIRGCELLSTLILGPPLPLTWSRVWSRVVLIGCYLSYLRARLSRDSGRLGFCLKGSEAPAVSPSGAGIVPEAEVIYLGARGDPGSSLTKLAAIGLNPVGFLAASQAHICCTRPLHVSVWPRSCGRGPSKGPAARLASWDLDLLSSK